MRALIILMLLSTTNLGFAQFVDDFSDGDLLANPEWSGDLDEFVIDNENRLRLNNLDPASNNESFLSTSSAAINDAVWEFKVGFDGLSSTGLSGSNRILVYLTSDRRNLEDDPSGYFLIIGGTEDEVSLYSSFSGKIIDGVDGVTASATAFISIRVIRDINGNWELLKDLAGADEYSSSGSVVNLDFQNSSFFGVLCEYTSTRSTRFFFDDFSVTGMGELDEEPPVILGVSAPSDTLLELQFSESLDRVNAEDISNYTVDNGIEILSVQQKNEDASLIELTVSSLINTENYTLTINGVRDLSQNAILPNTQFSFRYLLIETAVSGDLVINEFLPAPSAEANIPNEEFIELFNVSDKVLDLSGFTVSDNTGVSQPLEEILLLPQDYVILTARGNGVLFSPLGNVVEVSGWRALNNGGDDIIIGSPSQEVIASISYDNSETGISYELVNPKKPCLSFLDYKLSEDENGGTPGSQNSVFDDSPDLIAPATTKVIVQMDTLYIFFSEVMDASSLTNTLNYEIADLDILEVFLDEEEFPTGVGLTFDEKLNAGNVYSVLLQNLTDCSGNLLQENEVQFGIGRSPNFNELIISEILYDETPSFGLPEREYLELHNPTSSILSAANLFLSDASRTVSLPSFDLLPGSYVVLTSNSAASEFRNAVGVSSFPSLSNAGERLILSDSDGPIFSVKYDPRWQEEEKAEGGYSLEMVDLTNPCAETPANWRSSISTTGGTPASENSVNNPQSVPDNFGPSLLSATVIARDSLRLDFNEKINPELLSNATFTFSPSLAIDNVTLAVDNPNSVFVVFQEGVNENEEYRLSVSAISDCSGNLGENAQINFAFPLAPGEGEILLSEVLFNPRTNGVDFVELHNNSDNYLSLEGWQLARLTDEGISDAKIISDEPLVLNPRGFLVLTTNVDQLFSNYPQGNLDAFLELPSMPTFANDTGNVLLLNDLSEIEERFFYDEDFHFSLLESVDGVSLERVSYSQPTNNSSNWRSAASTVGFATPGNPNSQSFRFNPVAGRLSIEPKVFVPGNTGSGRDFTTINYQLEIPGQFANLIIYDQYGRKVKTLLEGALLETQGFIQWDGINDQGSLAKLGHHIILFEIYDGNGGNQLLKETVVVGRNF